VCSIMSGCIDFPPTVDAVPPVGAGILTPLSVYITPPATGHATVDEAILDADVDTDVGASDLVTDACTPCTHMPVEGLPSCDHLQPFTPALAAGPDLRREVDLPHIMCKRVDCLTVRHSTSIIITNQNVVCLDT
jgi:hypothetical protein